MKRIFSMLLFLILLTISSVSFAQVKLTSDQIALGGIHLWQPISYVQQIYGVPAKVLSDGSLLYGDYSIYISTYGKSGNLRVKSIMATADNGWKTPAGIKVGMNESVIQETYGKNFTTFKKKGIKYIQYDGYHCLAHLVFGVKDHKILFILISADQ